MKKKNLLIYLFFIFVIIMVPNRVSAYEYTLNSPCYSGEENDFWRFKECKVSSASVLPNTNFQLPGVPSTDSGTSTNNSDYKLPPLESNNSNNNGDYELPSNKNEYPHFEFNEKNSELAYPEEGKKVTYDNKTVTKTVCSIRITKQSSPYAKNVRAKVCDVYYIKNNYKASCVYTNNAYNYLIKVEVNTALPGKDIFTMKSSWTQKDGSTAWKKDGRLDFESFQYDGDCPSSINVRGSSWIYVKDESINKVERPSCTEEEKEAFQKEEAELFENYKDVCNKYKDKIEKREFGTYSTTPSSKLAELKTFAHIPYANLEKVYYKELDKLNSKYSCEGLPKIDRMEEVNDLLNEVKKSVLATVEELANEAKNSGDTEAFEIYNNFLENEADSFFSERENMAANVFEGISLNWDFGKLISDNCNELLGDDLIATIEQVFTWIKILAPILLIVFGSLDYAKAALANDNDALKKATSNFVKRAIAAVIIFFLPLIIELLFNLEGLSETKIGNPLCGISKVVIK